MKKVMLVEESMKMVGLKSVIRLWFTQTHTIDESRIQVPYPMSISPHF